MTHRGICDAVHTAVSLFGIRGGGLIGAGVRGLWWLGSTLSRVLATSIQGRDPRGGGGGRGAGSVGSRPAPGSARTRRRADTDAAREKEPRWVRRPHVVRGAAGDCGLRTGAGPYSAMDDGDSRDPCHRPRRHDEFTHVRSGRTRQFRPGVASPALPPPLGAGSVGPGPGHRGLGVTGGPHPVWTRDRPVQWPGSSEPPFPLGPGNIYNERKV